MKMNHKAMIFLVFVLILLSVLVCSATLPGEQDSHQNSHWGTDNSDSVDMARAHGLHFNETTELFGAYYEGYIDG